MYICPSYPFEFWYSDFNAATANLKLLNQVSQMFHGKDVVTFAEENAELPNISIND